MKPVGIILPDPQQKLVEERQCGACMWWVEWDRTAPNGRRVGCCQRRAPTYSPTVKDGVTLDRTKWPCTAINDRCGDFRISRAMKDLAIKQTEPELNTPHA